MDKYEFTWAIRPPPSRRRRGRQTINGFEVEITFSRIDVRTGFTDLPEDQLRKIAEEIAANLVRAVSFHERKHLTAVFRRVTCTSLTSEPTEIPASEDSQIKSTGEDEAQRRDRKAKGKSIDRAGEAELTEIFDLAQGARRNHSLRQILDRMGEFCGDLSRKFAPLYEILQRVEVQFGGRKRTAHALQIPFAELSRAAGIMNDPAISTSCHPRKNAAGLRAAKEEELSHCLDVAETVVRKYAARVLHKQPWRPRPRAIGNGEGPNAPSK